MKKYLKNQDETFLLQQTYLFHIQFNSTKDNINFKNTQFRW